MKALLSKLKHTAGNSLLLLNAPEKLYTQFSVDNEEVFTELNSTLTYNTILLFAEDVNELEKWGGQLVKVLNPATKCWIAYPKKTSGKQTTLTRDAGWNVLTELGYSPVAAISINETWSALRFRPEAEINRTATPKAGSSKTDRQLTIPDSILDLLNPHPAEKAFFNTLSYTNRKEYVNWISGAKKEETQQRRLAKMLDLLTNRKKNPSA